MRLVAWIVLGFGNGRRTKLDPLTAVLVRVVCRA